MVSPHVLAGSSQALRAVHVVFFLPLEADVVLERGDVLVDSRCRETPGYHRVWASMAAFPAYLLAALQLRQHKIVGDWFENNFRKRLRDCFGHSLDPRGVQRFIECVPARCGARPLSIAIQEAVWPPVQT